MENFSKGLYTIKDLGTDLEARHEVYFTLRFTMYVIWSKDCTYSVINLFNGTQSPWFNNLDNLMSYKPDKKFSLYDNWPDFHFRFIFG